jgi:Cytochrome c oxidase subunit IV
MKVASNLFVILGAFCLVTGAVLGFWGHEVAGTLYLVVLSCAFAYLAKETREFGDEPADAEEPDARIGEGHGDAAAGPVDAPQARDVAFHASAPTLTPFLFAIGGGLILAGLVFAQWLVLVGGGVMAVVAIAWFLETGKRREAEEAAKAGHGDHH